MAGQLLLVGSEVLEARAESITAGDLVEYLPAHALSPAADALLVIVLRSGMHVLRRASDGDVGTVLGAVVRVHKPVPVPVRSTPLLTPRPHGNPEIRQDNAGN